MSTKHLASAAGMVALALGSGRTAAAQPGNPQLLATDHMEAEMIGTDRRPLPLHEERLTVDIDGEHASTTLVQTYTNESSVQTEGRYQLRAGEDAHVDGFAYWNGEQKIVGEVFDTQTAHQVYNQVVARRRDPGLLEQVGEGVFAFKVFPIAPNEHKRVEVRWTRWLERHGQTVHYKAPATRDATIVATIAGPVANLRSSTHHLDVEHTATGLRVRATNPEVAGAFDLTWDVDEPAWTPDAYVQPASGGDDGYFALALAAPAEPAALAAQKDVTIVIDHSGSMSSNEKMAHAKRAAAAMVAQLQPGDRVNVISFSDEVDPLFA